MVHNLPCVERFSTDGDQSSLSQRWKAWRRSFEINVVAAGFTDDKQKRALLLHSAGKSVQDIFFTIGNTGKDYKTAMKNITDYFEPKKNVPYECHVFQSTAQNLGETMDKYVTRLKMLDSSCDFAEVNVEIRTR